MGFNMKFRFIVLLLLVLVTLGGVRLFNSLEGYCLDDKRRYSDDELVRIAVENLLLVYPKPAWGFDTYRESFRGEGVAQTMDNYINPKNVIYYKNVDEFLRLNTDCCSVVKARNVDEGELEYWKSVFGGGWRFVRIVYRLKYIADGRVQSPLVVWMGPVDSCGNATLDTSQSFLK